MALGCYSSSLLHLAAWASKSLDGFDGVRIWISLNVCVRTCALKVRVCKRGGILRDCLSHI